MANLKKNINLLPKEELEKTTIGKFIKWALGIGRYIIIFTELIVIVAFIARFKLDQDLTRLREEIQKKQTIINSYAQFEQKVKFLQKQLAFIKRTEGESLSASQVLSELSQITPIDVVFSELSIAQNQIIIKGSGLSNIGLNTFLNGLKNSKNFSQINLENVVSKGIKDPTLKFELSAKLNKD